LCGVLVLLERRVVDFVEVSLRPVGLDGGRAVRVAIEARSPRAEGSRLAVHLTALIT
jgi:hypothetical protein